VQAATDVGEGRLQIYMASYAILQPQTEAGRIKTIVVNGRERADAPNIPTAREAGFPALEVGRPHRPVRNLATLPKELVEKIGADVVAATKDPAVSARLSATAQTVNPGMPAEFAAAIQAQRDQIARSRRRLVSSRRCSREPRVNFRVWHARFDRPGIFLDLARHEPREIVRGASASALRCAVRWLRAARARSWCPTCRRAQR